MRPFRIRIPERALRDLRRRLSTTRWPERETPGGWSQGIPLSYMQELCAYWRDVYDWRRCEAALNAIPQYLTEIEGLDIHFLHVRSPEPNALPLVMTHGWPGSMIEFLQVIGPLTDPVAHGGAARDAFHLVVPSLPGYGFSGKPSLPGWGLARIAPAWDSLMQRLGYTRYVAQGGDWGSAVTHAIGLMGSPHCRGIHVNLPLVSPSPALLTDPTPYEQAALARLQQYFDWDYGTAKLHTTRPQTIGYGLVDSPVALAAWIIEKYWAWMDCHGHPENVLTRDELLDNVTLYWLTASGASSARICWESFATLIGDHTPLTLPVGVSVYPAEIFRASRRWCEERYLNLIHYNALDRGGHFAAFEQPALFVDELRACFAKLR
ncbi:MAG: epoxide hydrolase [Gammaproteobacteria bacterium]|nr:epoxide hydrolase [Gammaproteobacteria bacterium]